MRTLEEAPISEVIEDEELVTLSLGEEMQAEVAYEPLEGPDREFFTLDYIRQVPGFKDQGNVSFKTLNHRFRRVKHDTYITRFREYLKNMGTAREKYKSISVYVWEKFQDSQDSTVQFMISIFEDGL